MGIISDILHLAKLQPIVRLDVDWKEITQVELLNSFSSLLKNDCEESSLSDVCSRKKSGVLLVAQYYDTQLDHIQCHLFLQLQFLDFKQTIWLCSFLL